MAPTGSNAAKWILVVEDDEPLNKAVFEQLSTKGFRCVSALKATDAIAKLGKQKFDCVILDLRLEQQSGELVLEAMRSHRKNVNHDTPVLLMTGYADADIIRRLGSRISSILVKPFDQTGLLERVGLVFKGP